MVENSFSPQPGRQAPVLSPATGDDSRDPDLPGIFLNGAHLARWRGRTLAQLGDEAALTNLYGALTDNDATFTLATAGLYCDLARSHLARGERGQAVPHLRHARQLADRAGSARHRTRIDQLTATL